jgi:hypothetical protein
MDWVHDRRTTKVIAKGREDGMPIMPRKIEEGRWVKTIVFTLPMRFAIDDATSIDAADMMLVTKNSDPRAPSGRLNLRLK